MDIIYNRAYENIFYKYYSTEYNFQKKRPLERYLNLSLDIFKITRKTKISISFCFIFLLYSLLFENDLINAPKEDNYFSKNILDYPYVTIFNKEHILDVKNISQPDEISLMVEK